MDGLITGGLTGAGDGIVTGGLFAVIDDAAPPTPQIEGELVASIRLDRPDDTAVRLNPP